VSAPVPETDRALQALQWAAACAAGRAAIGTPPAASPADFERAATERTTEVRGLLDRVLLGPEPEAGLDALLACGALGAIVPAVATMVGFGDGEWRHKDLWKHTKQVVAQAPPELAVRWAALLHDIGKIRTRSLAEDGQVHFFGHAEVGARMFDKLHRRVPLFAAEPELRAHVHFLIQHHLRASQYASSWTDSAVRRFAREIGGHLETLVQLSRADITTKRPERRRQGLQLIDELCRRVRELAEQDAKQPALPSGIGNVLMEAFGLPPSRLIGDIRHVLEQKIEAGELPPRAAPERYVDYVRQHRSELGF
jgi:poly(A) polymerase